MKDNNVVPIKVVTDDPLDLVLDTILQNVNSMINMGHVMNLNHASKYRHVLVSISEMAKEELYHLDKKAA
ncbi:hypothetical protein [Dyadobacter sp. CY356]|uniref:hypothetical protein n=1 Tax=Dyadobacter sp. CY356 TaxID=2906442 RepID=UPI001F3CB73D|nr:hypothetical protein [Dyadobacter sp. CY356]MCF0055547.1 hypothetical protein [Dyadobacter sp. CY356]